MADPNGRRRLPTGDPDQANASPSRRVSAVDGVTGGEGGPTYSHFPPVTYEPTDVAYGIRDAANDERARARARHDQGGGAHDHHHDRPRQDQRGEAHLHDLPGEKSEVPDVGPSDQQGKEASDTDMAPLAALAKRSYDVNFPPLHEHRAAPVPAPAPAPAGTMGSSSAQVQGDGAPDNHDHDPRHLPRQDQRGGAHPDDLHGEKTIGSGSDILDDSKRGMINAGPQHGRITTSNGGSGSGSDKGKGVSYAGDKPASSSSSSSSAGQQGSDTDKTPSAAAASSYAVNFPPLLPTPAPAVAGAMGVANHKSVLCSKWRKGRCHNGGACRYSHGEEEQRIVPEMRVGGGGRPCPELAAAKGWCRYGLNCKYCHGGV
uniref:C3H1-type domain-containing protein n=1 Tax=Oryza barthii TaxID=65489 RepID=A0A0D3GM27_9ORYZ